MKNKTFAICVIIFSLSFLTSCSDPKLDAETQGVVDGILANSNFVEKSRGNMVWTKKDAICWVQETKKLVSDYEWKIFRSRYDPNFENEFWKGKILPLMPKLELAEATCKVKMPG